MEVLLNKINKLKDVDILDILYQILSDKKIQDWIISVIKWEQLYDEGIRGDGVSLGEYTDATKKLKLDPVISHVTLKETGEFYSTFKFELNKDNFIIDADSSNKIDRFGYDLFERYDNQFGDLLGLTDENMERLINRLIPLINEQILRLWD